MTTQQLLLSLGSGAGQELTYVNAATGIGTTTRLTLTHPSDVQAGDMCVLFHNTWDNDSDFVDTAPTGFNMINTDPYLYTTATYMAHSVSYNVVANPASSVTLPLCNGDTQSPDNQGYVALYFRPFKTISSVNFDSSVNLQETAANPTLQTVRAAGNTPPIIVFAQAKSLTTIPPFVSSTTFDGFASFNATNIDANVGYKIYNTSPVDHDVDMNDNGTNVLLSFYLRVE